MNNLVVSIITPTYNRGYILGQLFNSLQKQNCFQFEWVIIDDGSTDDTKNIVSTFCNRANFNIIYIEQTNSGKHVAINRGIEFCKGELTFIVDSDDYLTPDAIKMIIHDWKIYKNPKICGMSYLRGYDENKSIGKSFPHNSVISNYIEMRTNKNIYGDKAEVWKTQLLIEHPFPVFENENFLGEGAVWGKLAEKYDMVFFNKIIYICQYLEGGLSKSGRKLRINNPLGGMYHANVLMNKKIKLSIRIKNSWLYICYGLFAKKSFEQIVESSEYKDIIFFNIPFGWILYKYWKLKYGGKQ